MNTVRDIHAANLRDDPDYRAAYQALAPEFERAADNIDRRMDLERDVVTAAVQWAKRPDNAFRHNQLMRAVHALNEFNATNANAPGATGARLSTRLNERIA